MQFSLLSTIIAAAMVSCSPLIERDAEAGAVLEKRACFNGGVTWGGERNAALQAAFDACVSGGLSGQEPVTYGSGETRFICINLSSLKKVDFALKLVSGGTRSIGFEECIDGLRKEIDNCNQGGRTAYGNWEYASDPNEGQC